MNKPDLKKAGGRLKSEIERVFGDTFDRYVKTDGKSIGRTLQKWVNLDDLPRKKIEKFAERLPGIDVEYIVTGKNEENMHLSEKIIDIISANSRTIESQHQIIAKQSESITDILKEMLNTLKELRDR